MINLEKKEDIIPICPHCNKPLDTVYFKELRSTFGRRYIYFCPACHKTLGVSHRKGFFMG
ncbi:MAG: hypothetical protein Kow00108_22780 [Calditrichia bacterium]